MGRQTEAMIVDSAPSSSDSSDSSKRSMSTDGRGETPPPEHCQPTVVMRRTVFDLQEVASVLTSTWSRRPDDKLLEHVNQSSLQNADRSVWRTARGRYLTGDVPRLLRHHFIEDLGRAITADDVVEACEKFHRALRTWFAELEHHGRSTAVGKAKKNATALEIQHRVRSFRCLETIRELGQDPSKRRLYDLRSSLKELWTLTCLSDY